MITKKLKDKKGITIVHALIGILLFAMISSVIFVSSMASMQAFANIKTQQQSYLTVSSAAKLFVDSINGDTFNKVVESVKTSDKEEITVNKYVDLVSNVTNLGDKIIVFEQTERVTVKEGYWETRYSRLGIPYLYYVEPEYDWIVTGRYRLAYDSGISSMYTTSATTFPLNSTTLSTSWMQTLLNGEKKIDGYTDSGLKTTDSFKTNFLKIYEKLNNEDSSVKKSTAGSSLGSDVSYISESYIFSIADSSSNTGYSQVKADVCYTMLAIYANFYSMDEGTDSQYKICVKIPINMEKGFILESEPIYDLKEILSASLSVFTGSALNAVTNTKNAEVYYIYIGTWNDSDGNPVDYTEFKEGAYTW